MPENLLEKYMGNSVSWENTPEYTGNYVQSKLGNSYHLQSLENLEKYTVGTVNQMQRYFAQGGIFSANPDIENPIMNLTLQPRMTLASLIPAIPTELQEVKFGFIATYDNAADVTATDIDGTVCEDCPSVGDDAAIFMTYTIGRMCFQTRKGEWDAILRLANRNAQDLAQRVYFVGDVRGMSGSLPIVQDPEQQRDIIRMGVVRREMQKVARRFERYLATWLWAGNPTDAKQNTSPAGHSEDDAWRSFQGLDILIADDYQDAVAHPNITGTVAQKQQLNSIVYDFSSLDVNGGNDAVIGYTPIYGVLEHTEGELYKRGERLGYSNVDTVIVMRSEIWQQLSNHLPKEMATLYTKVFTNPDVSVNLNDGATSMQFMMERNRLRSEQTLTLNNRTYPVIIDDFIQFSTSSTVAIGAGTIDAFISQIYFVPLRVDNIPVLYWRYADYRNVADALQPIPNAMMAMNGWHDDGKFLSVLEPTRFCFQVYSKCEFGLELIAPHLAAKITNVRVVDEYGYATLNTAPIPDVITT